MSSNFYDFIHHLTTDQLRVEIVEYANKTGAEINNFSIRTAIDHFKNGRQFPLLDAVELFVGLKYRLRSVKYLGDCIVSGEDIVLVLRDKMNMQNALDSHHEGIKKFWGECPIHGFCEHNIYGSTKYITYKCGICVHEKLDSEKELPFILYNRDRNILLDDFLKRNKKQISIDAFSLATGVRVKVLNRYLERREVITHSHWLSIKTYIKKCLITGRYEISKGLEFDTVFRHIIQEMEGLKNAV